ncbi:MAG TPA: hypothetical protein VNR87_05595 [Flavisolibacter sp.]|nr:hypothetical protein [Flavisolibacter sp.]
MRRSFFLCIIILASNFDCLAQNSAEDKCPATEESAKFDTGWILNDTVIVIGKDTNQFKVRQQGNGITFKFARMFDCPDIFDEEHWDILTWYIADTATRFEIILSGKPSNVDYSFAYAGRSFQPISAKGTISGEKIGAQWKVAGNVHATVPRTYHTGPVTYRDISFSTMFNPGLYEKVKTKKKRKNV